MAYILDLYAIGKQIPKNPNSGYFSKTEIIKIAETKYQLNGNSFYKSVLDIINYDLNNTQDLMNISNNWLDAVRSLTENWELLESYLIKKKLLGSEGDKSPKIT